MTWCDTDCAINWHHPLEGLFAPPVMIKLKINSIVE
jgi:hypothetical protein